MRQFTVISTGNESTGRFDLQECAALSGMHPQWIVELARANFVRAVEIDSAGDPRFDEAGVIRLRRIESLWRHHGVSMRAIRHIVQLQDRLEAAEREVRRLREMLR